MKNDPIAPPATSAGLPGILRLTAGFAVLALAALAALVILDLVPREQVAPVGRKIVLLTVVVGLASTAIAGLVGWRRRS
jgi:hypothetical protein